MTNRLPALLVLVFAAIGSLAAREDLRAAESRSGRPPNVVMIISDDQRWTDFGFMRHSAIKTPHLDRLAARSAVFRRGYVPASLCRPSLATLITGLYPHQHRITGNDPPRGTDRSLMLTRIRDVPTLPRLLAQKGYRSFQAGKWWEGAHSLGGFTDGMTHGDPRRGGRHGDEGLRIGREGLKPIFDFIDSCGESPYFLWYAPMMPHLPHTPPKRLLDKYAVAGRPLATARYFAMCEWFDETCGELLAFLDRKGRIDNTLIVFVVDNGWAPPDADPKQRDPRFGQFGPRSKQSPYDGGIRTPILVCWPGKVPPADYPTLVGSIDLAPTILAAAGLAKTSNMPGLDLLQAIARRGHCPRTELFGEIFTHDVADIDDPLRGLRYRWCITDSGEWKLISSAMPGEGPELYNLSQDADETRNRAAELPERVRQMSRRLDEWWPGPAKKTP